MRLVSLGKALLGAALCVGALSGGVRQGYAQAADNSGQNKSASPTADNQGSGKSDRMLTAQIRKALIADKGLSVYAHNVKIVVVNGAVTLKGPVHSDEEKQKVVADAGSVVEPGRITDQLTVKQ